MKYLHLSIPFLFLALPAFVGCDSSGPATGGGEHDHDHDHDHGKPKSLYAAIGELNEIWSEISTAVSGDDPEAAHEPLHEVGEVLAAMSGLAAETDLGEGKWNEVKKTANDLMAAFGEIDDAFHQADGDKKAAYESAKPAIEQGLAELAKIKEMLPPEESDDHEHGDEKDHDHEDGEDHGESEIHE